MRNTVAALAVLSLLAACDGNPLLVDEPTVDDPLLDQDGEEVEVTDDGIPVSIARSLGALNYDPVAKTLQVTLAGIDGTPTAVTYVRNPGAEAGLPVGYEAYTLQEDPLDRFFTGVVRASFDNTVRAGVVSDGGQFGRFVDGGYYERTGDFDAPDIGNGPGQGQVSYAGGYVGLDNFTGPRPPMPPGTDPSIQPEAPGRVVGKVFINANFSDMLINGSVFDRQYLDVNNVPATNLFLTITDITEDGAFIGQVETPINGERRGVGEYAGIFGGTNSSSVGGIVKIENYVDTDTNGNPILEESEIGVFVLNQCGTAGEDPTLCTGTAP